MRILACAHLSLLSRTRYVKRGCRCNQQNYRVLFDQERAFKGQANVLVMPLTSTLTCLRVTGSNCCGNLSECRRADSIVVGRTIYPAPLTRLCCITAHLPTLIFHRNLHIGSPLFDKEPLKPSSKVEQTVECLKKLEESGKLADSDKVRVKESLWQRFKNECMHYYHGFRLLFIDINVSRKLLWRVIRGKSLSRREHRLLVRTTSDLFRLVPFSVFIVVPFMEFLLPFFIKFFPGMLPSTFETATDKEAKMKRALKVNIEVAKFLQETLDEMAVKATGHSDISREFTEFFAKARSSGHQVTTQEILKFSKLFEDEFTLDSLPRPQLIALCRILELHTIGTNNFLRFQLRMKLRSLAADDKMIQKEGIDSLTVSELQQACKARGMRAYGLSQAHLRSELAQWLDLSLNEKVPPTLLLLSRALLESPETIPASDQLKATIQVLPETLVTQAKAAIEEREGKIDNKTKIDVIKQEVRLIKEEHLEMREEQKKMKDQGELVDTAPILKDEAPEMMAAKELDKKKELTPTDLEALECAVDEVSKERKKLLMEREELHELKEELAEYQEDVADLKQVAGESKVEVRETKGAQRLFKKVSSMINKMDAVLVQLEKEEELLKKDIQSSEESVETKKKSEELVTIEELIKAIKQVQKVPDESLVERLSEALSKIDLDQDGAIRVDDLRKVIEVVGKEKVKLSKKQLDEIVDLMSKEEIIELEEQIGKVLEKESQAVEKKAHKQTEVEQGKKKCVGDGSSQSSIKTKSSQGASISEPTDGNRK